MTDYQQREGNDAALQTLNSQVPPDSQFNLVSVKEKKIPNKNASVFKKLTSQLKGAMRKKFGQPNNERMATEVSPRASPSVVTPLKAPAMQADSH